ncbi:MAG TPA: endonuclease domain-containing protein [Bacteroidia bacterium]|nr:endonuclease domain-containing protein [Bacteroidia bacterium]
MKRIINQSYGASDYLFDNAKKLRKRSTTAEHIFWQIVRSRKILGFKFRRQHPIKYFIADFYCHEASLVIELDGTIHELGNIKRYDMEREAILNGLGISVLRFTNEEVFSDIDNVILKLEKYLSSFKCKLD